MAGRHLSLLPPGARRAPFPPAPVCRDSTAGAPPRAPVAQTQEPLA